MDSINTLMDNDFSSPYFWEDFYKQLLEEEKAEQLADTDINSDNESDVETASSTSSTTSPSFVFEWHNSISLESLADLIPKNSNCLMVGCGNSLLPRAVLDRQADIRMTLLDTSATCLEQLQQQYQDHPNEVSFVCGSATKMSHYFESHDEEQTSESSYPFFCQEQQQATTSSFDIIVDKGLLDAFMCGDGWESPIKDLFRESSKLFATNDNKGGTYLLVSYKIGPAIRELFQEMCKEIGDESGLQWDWEFEMEAHSNHRVSVSMATVRPI